MGREVRRVPPNWQHPKDDRGHYAPMRDEDAETAWAEWLTEFEKWKVGENARIVAEYGSELYPLDQPYVAFCNWHGRPPNPKYYRPKWDDSAATWYQAYETVSEGTPVSPPFETPEELIDYLTANGDFWDQKRRSEGRIGMSCDPWDREYAERFVRGGWAPSLIVSPAGIETPGHPAGGE